MIRTIYEELSDFETWEDAYNAIKSWSLNNPFEIDFRIVNVDGKFNATIIRWEGDEDDE